MFYAFKQFQVLLNHAVIHLEDNSLHRFCHMLVKYYVSSEIAPLQCLKCLLIYQKGMRMFY